MHMKEFLGEIEKVANALKPVMKKKSVVVYSHYDADGIASAAIMAKSLLRLKSSFQIAILNQLTKKLLQSLNYEDKLLIFLDFGSGQLHHMEHLLNRNLVLIIDHHKPKKLAHLNLFHLNPHLFNQPEASSSVYTYFFSKFLSPQNSNLCYLALVGYFGDNIFSLPKDKYFKKVVEDCKNLGYLEIKKGLKIFGRYTKPLHKALAQSYECFIPGITGSEASAVQLLSELGIKIKKENGWQTLADLSEREEKKLATEIIKHRIKEEVPEDVFGELFLLKKFPKELKDVREFATLLNSLGRKKHEIAINLALGNFRALEEALKVYEQYRKELASFIDFAKKSYQELENIVVIDGKEKIPDYAIGIIASIFSKSKISNKPVFALAKYDDETLKISARFDGSINLAALLKRVAEELGGEAGGHSKAAGAFIPLEQKRIFIKKINKAIGDAHGKNS